jgi:transcription elongation GreA/GreB family factor
LKFFKGLLSFLSVPALKRRRLMKNTPDKRTFSEIDYYRLQNILAQERTAAYRTHARQIARLRGLLLQGQLCPCKKVPGDLVTMNSVLRLQLKQKAAFTVCLVYPRQGNFRERKCSVLSSMGLRLIGKRQGDYFRNGVQIAEIVYQPESDGKFYV